MNNHREGPTARPAWLFNEKNYKSLIYSKTATTLHTLQNLIGESNLDTIIKSYFNLWKFKHPKGIDFMNLMKSELLKKFDSVIAIRNYELFECSLYDSKILDYAVTNITYEHQLKKSGIFDSNYLSPEISALIHSKVHVERTGDWIIPVEIQINFENGSSQIINWSGIEGSKILNIYNSSKVISAHIDPKHNLLLDIDLNNNSFSVEPNQVALIWYSNKFMFYFQNILQSLSILL